MDIPLSSTRAAVHGKERELGVRANFDETDKLYLEELCVLAAELMGRV